MARRRPLFFFLQHRLREGVAGSQNLRLQFDVFDDHWFDDQVLEQATAGAGLDPDEGRLAGVDCPVGQAGRTLHGTEYSGVLATGRRALRSRPGAIVSLICDGANIFQEDWVRAQGLDGAPYGRLRGFRGERPTGCALASPVCAGNVLLGGIGRAGTAASQGISTPPDGADLYTVRQTLRRSVSWPQQPLARSAITDRVRLARRARVAGRTWLRKHLLP